MSKKITGWNLDNTYTNLSDLFYRKIELNMVNKPSLVILNEPLASSLGLDINELKSLEGTNILAGNKPIEDGSYIAQAYCGHQFGHFTMLGDGRALLIGEQITPDGKRYDIQLKGSGKTPYSRGGDGRAALGPMLREYIISEAMHGLGIPTTRSLAVVKTGQDVIREETKPGAILTRVASSHIRFGTFQYATTFGDKEKLKQLADYSISRHYPYIKEGKEKYLNFLKEVIKSHAQLVAKWQSVGFIHGVMNTDNMTISGETIDYGPCAFMDTYHPNTVFSSIDESGRYAYKNQPSITEWNLYRFAETLIPILHNEKEEAISIATNELSKFTELYHQNWLSIMRNKLGIFNEELQDKALVEDLLSIIKKYKEDYTNTFVALTLDKYNTTMFESAEFNNWNKLLKDRLSRQENSTEEVSKLMKASNPAVIPRNHRVEEALQASEKGDYSKLIKLLEMLRNPFEYNKEQDEYSKLPKACKYPYKTYCGT